MRIKSLELIGFKSFVDRTTINFEEGVTGIVGPNGCGKSNVVDAIRWVMGEQSAKHLRGDAMQDVIFSGSETRAPLGMANVFLTFDNSDGRAPAEFANYAEITVGRRLYRSGESEYYINKTPCRLKDIVDLFLGTGTGTKAYSIVEQGRIGQIVSAKPEERRYFIEEAAGISKFKNRKEAALRKMEATRGNLQRLNDIITELDRQLTSLSRQAKKAERYREYSNELREVEMGFAAHQWRSLHEEFAAMQENLSAAAEREKAGETTLAQLEAQTETARLNLADDERKLSQLQDQAYALQNTVHLHEAEIQKVTAEISSIEARAAASAAEIDNLRTQRARWQAELTDANAAKIGADMEFASAQERVQQAQTALASLNTRHEELRTQIERLQAEVLMHVQRLSENQSKQEQLERREIDIDSSIAKNQSQIDGVDRKLSELSTSLASGRGTLSGRKQMQLHLQDERSAVEQELVNQEGLYALAKEDTAALKGTLHGSRSRLKTFEEMQASFAGYEAGVQAILKSEKSGVFGTVAHMISTEPRYETAVGAVLGEKLQYVVVQSHSEGVEAIDYLKSAASGRSTFIPLTLRHEEDAKSFPEGDGVVGPLSQFVRWNDEFNSVGRFLFRDVVVVEDLGHGLNLWQQNGHRATLVTLDGEVIHPAGVISGGAGGDVASEFLKRRREIEELQTDVARLGTALAVAERREEECAGRVTGLQKHLKDIAHDAHAEELQLAHHHREVQHLEAESDRYMQERDRLSLETACFANDLHCLGIERDEAAVAVALAGAGKARCEEALGMLRGEEEEIRERLRAVSEEFTKWKMSLASQEERVRSVDREIERLISSSTDASCRTERKTAEISGGLAAIESSRATIARLRDELGSVVQEAASVKERQQAVQSRFGELMEKLRGLETETREIRRQYEEARSLRHETELVATQHQERAGHLRRDIQDKYRISIDECYEQYCCADYDPESATVRLQELRDRIERLGGVNTDAIQEYEEIKSRYEFLTQQAADLSAALDSLQRAIQNINRISRQRFGETFAAVNVRFEQLFPKLFQGGKARLVLTDEEDLLESGVEIIAQPPGKKLQSVSLLSGGEKALTAVAMIFAMFLTRPSPFCLLDEVDAPLDDANIDRFNDMIREMTSYSQFILITHNKRTMELADTLYGVTMENPGVSKIVSVRLNQGEGSPETAAA